MNQPAPDSATQATGEQQDAAEAESYGGTPVSDSELADVWTSDGADTEGGQDAPADPPSARPAETSGAAPAEDVESDPAKADEVGADWTDEGGATGSGPATNLEPPD